MPRRIGIGRKGARAIGIANTTENLRSCLRGATAAAHDLLDGSMRAAAGWDSREDYVRFLSLQYAARAPVEQWLARHAPRELAPPPQCPLIDRDLAELASPLPEQGAAFQLKPNAGEGGRGLALGASWVLAGSSLGNRSILKEVQRVSAKDLAGNWPTAFLADPEMLQFWSKLRRRIERPAGPEEVTSASHAAMAVFDHFIAHARPEAKRKENVLA